LSTWIRRVWQLVFRAFGSKARSRTQTSIAFCPSGSSSVFTGTLQPAEVWQGWKDRAGPAPTRPGQLAARSSITTPLARTVSAVRLALSAAAMPSISVPRRTPPESTSPPSPVICGGV
jgi:hypothetical protein